MDIRLTEEEIARAIQAATDTAAIASERCTRYASPDERTEVGRRIDPETAQVFFIYALTLDPYGDGPELPEEYRQGGREFFAVNPDEGVAVWLGDLPTKTREALAAKRDVADREGWRVLGR
jgi:hypothetical protein